MEQLKLQEHRTRQWLAVGIVVAGVVAVTILGAISIFRDGAEAENVLGQILPLFGTWVGAVIAFYFAKDNLETAARTTKELMTLDHRLKSVTVQDAMIPVGSIQTLKQLAKAKDLEDLEVSEIFKAMARNRMPVVDSKRAVVAVIHKSTLSEYLTAQALDGKAAADPKTVTFKEFSAAEPALYSKLKAYAFVGVGETLADAKLAMEQKSEDCSDVFVTATGKPAEELQGWITNVEIAKRSQA